jgi:hypothetical protein
MKQLVEKTNQLDIKMKDFVTKIDELEKQIQKASE